MSEKNVKEEAKTDSEKEELYEWAAENFDKIIENVQTILHNNPNRFVSIREIAGKLHWPFKGYVELQCMCVVAVCSREYDLDSEWLEYKYKGEITDEDRPWYKFDEKICRKARDEVLSACKKPRQRRKLEEGYNQLEETMKQLIKMQKEERDTGKDR